MAANLVIVESPAKARTIGKILGRNFIIKASLGHVRDLPKKELGIDITNNFVPKYVVIQQRRGTIQELKKLAESASAIYLATDPDREGEAISWHLIEAAKLDEDKVPVRRVVFHEITKEAVEHAFRNPRSIDMNLVNAQQARRLLDRLVGYKLSPLLWRKIQRGLSAGRVQSSALRLIVDREREIQNFVPIEYWTIEVELTKSEPKISKLPFRALFIGLADGTKLEIPNQQEADKFKNELYKSVYAVKAVQVKDTFRQPAPPFITSTLQQEAWRKLRLTASRTMVIAQQLYEGVPIGKEGSVGLITYMRTDSTNVAASAIAETRDFIKNKFGDDFLPIHPRSFEKKRKWAQEAHEAIRPTRIHREPDQVRPYLTAEQAKLYGLIWKRMVASQMAAAVFGITMVDVEAKCPESRREYLLRATSSVAKFPGFMSLYSEGKDDSENGNEKAIVLPALQPGDKLALIDLFSEQCFTQPPPRYTEATLIKVLEQKGIGRPSTYAPILSTIQERGYVLKEKGRIYPDEIGIVVSDMLTQHFPKIVDLSFTARMEKDLDKIAQGDKDWVSVLRTFYSPFEQTLARAGETIEKVKVAKMTDEACPECGRPMVIKAGRFGKFLACSGYPQCKKTMPLLVKMGVTCPECDQGELVERVSKRKRRFYGCSRYPKCQFTINRKPIAKPCPQCGKLLTIYRNNLVKCTTCEYKDKLNELDKVEATV
jgi:DNA topoisomerase-1